jgi:methionyl-tRNA formyltransferase
MSKIDGHHRKAVAGKRTWQVGSENQLYPEPLRGGDESVDPVALRRKEKKDPLPGHLFIEGFGCHAGRALLALEPYYGDPESPSSMNVVLFAWCPTATSYLDALAVAGATPVLLVASPRTPAAGPLAAWAVVHGVTLERCEDVNAGPFVARMQTLAVDLLLIAGCSQILRRPVRQTARLGTINFHPSWLPAYRAKEPLFWTILRGETRAGCTAHHATEAIDRGPILLQREVRISPRSTSASLAKDVDDAGATMIPELLAMARGGALPSGKVPAEPGEDFPALEPEHGLCDFRRSAIELDRLVRACAGAIQAYCFFEGMRLVLLEAEPGDAPPHPVAAGTVIEVGGNFVRIATADGSLVARRFLFVDRVHDGRELSGRLGLVAGSRLMGGEDAQPSLLWRLTKKLPG